MVATLDFKIDKLTRSIENVITGDNFSTEILYLNKSDLLQVSKKNGWVFDWKQELSYNDREVYKLTIQSNPNIIQGLLSLQIERDHVYLHLIESAPFNKGKHKVYLGVPGNLVAFACRLSFQKGHEGFLSFRSKTKLIEHYEKTLGAKHYGGLLMIIDTVAAKNLIDKYFKS
ncbi:MAG: hypothetical protein HY738_20115 [Bacteroidia bacterium]|nr:hypothetical protein [Bacteroidia bacterium]